MADLTDEQKIIIGISSGIAALILIGIIIFLCYIFYGNDKRRRRNGYKDRLVMDRYERERPPHTVYEKTVPPYMYDPPPLPPPPPMWREPLYYKKPRSMEREPPHRYDSWDRYSEPPRKQYSDHKWNGVFRNEPIIVPMSQPEYIPPAPRPREPDTIYLKSDRHNRSRSRYVDDHALMHRANHARRTEYGHLRRTRSFHDVRRGTPYVGEWGTKPEKLTQFNENALRAGHDPFLWQ